MVLEVGIDGRGSHGSYSLGLINSRDGSPVRAVEPSDCRITAYREEIAESKISGLVPFCELSSPKSIAQIESCARPRSPNSGRATRGLCVLQRGKEDRREAARWGNSVTVPHHPPALMTKFRLFFFTQRVQGPSGA